MHQLAKNLKRTYSSDYSWKSFKAHISTTLHNYFSRHKGLRDKSSCSRACANLTQTPVVICIRAAISGKLVSPEGRYVLRRPIILLSPYADVCSSPGRQYLVSSLHCRSSEDHLTQGIWIIRPSCTTRDGKRWRRYCWYFMFQQLIQFYYSSGRNFDQFRIARSNIM